MREDNQFVRGNHLESLREFMFLGANTGQCVPDGCGKGEVCRVGKFLRQLLFNDGAPFFFRKLACILGPQFDLLQVTTGSSTATVG